MIGVINGPVSPPPRRAGFRPWARSAARTSRCDRAARRGRAPLPRSARSWDRCRCDDCRRGLRLQPKRCPHPADRGVRKTSFRRHRAKDVAAELGHHEHTVGKWRRRFLKDRCDGLLDEVRPGRPRTIDDDQVAAVIERTLRQIAAGQLGDDGLASPNTLVPAHSEPAARSVGLSHLHSP